MNLENHKSGSDSILFLSLESPWPPYSGASIRTLGLLKEISKSYSVHLVVTSRLPLSIDQQSHLMRYAQTIERIPLRDQSFLDKLNVLQHVIRSAHPYHSALIELSLKTNVSVIKTINDFPGIIFTNMGHWGTMVRESSAPNWLLNQCDADVEFWKVYAAQSNKLVTKLLALLNWKLSEIHFKRIYENVGRIISVCEEDKVLTLALSPDAKVDVIQNGVDCSYMYPQRQQKEHQPRILFTGTSAPRNVSALIDFTKKILPIISRQIPNVELLVGGNFSAQAQKKFSVYSNVRFSGRIDDIRPLFNNSDVYIIPFSGTHGSKLKVAEAMAMGMAIVSTLHGIRGFPLKHGESVLLGSNADEFANGVITLLRDSERRDALGKAAREIAVKNIDWNVLGIRLREIIDSMISLNHK